MKVQAYKKKESVENILTCFDQRNKFPCFILFIDNKSDIICCANFLFCVPWYTLLYTTRVPSLLNMERMCSFLEYYLTLILLESKSD